MEETKVRRHVELGSVVSHVRVTALPADVAPNLPFVGLEDIEPEAGRFASLSEISKVSSRVFRFEGGDILYGRLRPYLRKAAIADFDGCASGEIVVMRCSDRILPRFLLTVLLSEDFNRFVNERAKGDRPRTSFAMMSTYRFDLPSREVQAEVADNDDRLGNAVSRLAFARTEIDRCASSLLEKTRLSLIWDQSAKENLVPFEDLVESINYGTSQKSVEDGAGTAVLRIPNIGADGRIDTANLKFAQLGSKEKEQFSVRPNDLLMIRSNGSLSLVGRAALVEEADKNYAFAGYLLRLRPKTNVLAQYLLELVHSIQFRQMVEAAARSTNGINNLSASRLSKFLVPLPPAERQQQIVSTLVRLQREVLSSLVSVEEMWIAALALHKTSRQVWLGQRSIAQPVSVPSEKISEYAATRNDSAVELTMAGNVETTLLARLDSEESGQATFEKLAEGIGADYEVLRDAVFAMLASTPRRLEQVFDEHTRTIMLRRPK